MLVCVSVQFLPADWKYRKSGSGVCSSVWPQDLVQCGTQNTCARHVWVNALLLLIPELAPRRVLPTLGFRSPHWLNEWWINNYDVLGLVLLPSETPGALPSCLWLGSQASPRRALSTTMVPGTQWAFYSRSAKVTIFPHQRAPYAFSKRVTGREDPHCFWSLHNKLRWEGLGEIQSALATTSWRKRQFGSLTNWLGSVASTWQAPWNHFLQ